MLGMISTIAADLYLILSSKIVSTKTILSDASVGFIFCLLLPYMYFKSRRSLLGDKVMGLIGLGPIAPAYRIYRN